VKTNKLEKTPHVQFPSKESTLYVVYVNTNWILFDNKIHTNTCTVLIIDHSWHMEFPLMVPRLVLITIRIHFKDTFITKKTTACTCWHRVYTILRGFTVYLLSAGVRDVKPKYVVLESSTQCKAPL